MFTFHFWQIEHILEQQFLALQILSCWIVLIFIKEALTFITA